MDRPVLPPVAPGRSALPAFLDVEAELRQRALAEQAKADAAIVAAEEQVRRIREQGEERLKQLVLDAEAAATREAEAKARDRISDVRVKTQRWIEAAERAAQDAVDAAVRHLIGDDPGAR